jgi:aspartate/methionine/tyrosine aminotransferase
MRFSEAVERMRFSKATGYFGKDYGDVKDFSLGEPKDAPPGSVIRALTDTVKSERESNRYASVQGLPELRERVAEKLREKNKIEAKPEEVFIAGGASEGIAFTIMSFIAKGDEAVIVEPSYPIVSPMVRFCGGRPVNLFLEAEKDFSLDIERLKALVNKRTRLIALNTPHNPTGKVFEKRELKAISEVFDGPIMVDEVYENFTYGKTHHSLASISGRPENVITINSFSKTYCMCGYRVGYLHASEEIIKRMLKLKLCVSTCTNRSSQKAAMAAIEDKRFPRMIKKLRNLSLPHVKPQGAFYVFPDISEFGDDKEAFGLFLKAGVMTMPGTVFHENCNRHLRMSFVADKEEINEGLQRLEGVLA